MAKEYWLEFKLSDGSLYSSASPTFLLFQYADGTTSVPPGVTQRIAGTGAYQFNFAGSTISAFFRVDGGASLTPDRRYIEGVLDPILTLDQKVGTTADSIGFTATDPTTIFGYVKRSQEFNEGNATYVKATGVWSIASRGNTLLAVKTLNNDTTSANKG